MSAIDNLKAVLLDPEGNVSIQGSEEDKRIIQKALTEIEKPIVETPDVQRLIGEVVKLQAALAKTDEENTKLKVIEAYWRDYKKVVKAFGFPDAYPGGINRWIQDKLAENKQLKEALSPFVRFKGFLDALQEADHKKPATTHDCIVSAMGCGASDYIWYGDLERANQALSIFLYSIFGLKLDCSCGKRFLFKR